MVSRPERARQHVRRYLDEQAVSPPERGAFPAPLDTLRASVVIPAYDERETLGTVIEALRGASSTPECFEVIIVVNQPSDAPAAIDQANREALEMLSALETPFPLHVIDRCTEGQAFPPDEAGVGRARRLGMDLALARLQEAGAAVEGIIPCLDADSPAEEGYIDDVLETFATGPEEMLAGVCRYRHPIPDVDEHARAIAAYESWMRYFEAGLHLTRTPYAFQSIGSCMVLSAQGYALADGVPPRPALSDFYLLQKIIKAGGRGAVQTMEAPMVYPSARTSERVPRGTGPSVQSILDHEVERYIHVEPPATFEQLRAWFAAIRPGFEDPERIRDAASDALMAFLDQWDSWETIASLREHAPDAAHFERSFHEWFDSLKIVRFANMLRRRGDTVPLVDAVRRVLEDLGRSSRAKAIPRDASPPFEAEHFLEVLEVLRESELEWSQAASRDDDTME